MKLPIAILSFAISTGLTASAAASPASTSGPSARNAEPEAQAQFRKAAPAEAPAPVSHTFRVNDKTGPLLTCIAPNITTDPDTDLFESCALAPGRTLDDLMHTFVGAIHYVQNQQAEERAEWVKALEEKTDPKPSQK